MKIYTIRDIAEKAGVSVTTVSRVLNHRPDVNPATRAKVEKIIAECHFVGNANARSLKQTDSDLAAVILRGHQNPFLNALAEEMLQQAADSKTSFMLEFIDEKEDEFRTALRLSHEKHAKGFIFVGGRPDERIKVLSGMNVPMVFSTVTVEKLPIERASSVAVDDRALGYQAVKTLLDQGIGTLLFSVLHGAKAITFPCVIWVRWMLSMTQGWCSMKAGTWRAASP